MQDKYPQQNILCIYAHLFPGTQLYHDTLALPLQRHNFQSFDEQIAWAPCELSNTKYLPNFLFLMFDLDCTNIRILDGDKRVLLSSLVAFVCIYRWRVLIFIHIQGEYWQRTLLNFLLQNKTSGSRKYSCWCDGRKYTRISFFSLLCTYAMFIPKSESAEILEKLGILVWFK